MPTDTHKVTIEKPIAMVFNYVTTPAWWPIYHPTSRKVEPFLTQSLQAGETTVETCILDPLGRIKFVIHWEGTENDGCTRFKMEGRAKQFGGAEGIITYNLREDKGATYFERVFEYEINGIFGKLFETQADLVKGAERRIRTAGKEVLVDLKAYSNPIEILVGELISKDGRDSLDNVKAILESMPS